MENKGLLLSRKVGNDSVVVNGLIEITPIKVHYEFTYNGKAYKLVPFNNDKTLANSIPHDDPKLVWVLQKDDGAGGHVYLRLMNKDKIDDPKQPPVIPILLYREPTTEELMSDQSKGHDFPVYKGKKIETLVKYLKTNHSVIQPLTVEMPFEFTDNNLTFQLSYENMTSFHKVSMRFVADPFVKIYRRELLDENYQMI